MYNYRMVDTEKLEFVPVATTSEVGPGQRMLLNVGDLSLAVFNIAGIASDVPMTEAAGQPGVYVGSYRIRSGDVAQSARVTVRLTLRGTTQQAEATARLTILAEAEVPPPTVTSPASGARITTPLVIRGRTLPGYQVAVRVDYRGMFLVFTMQGTLGRFTATADAAGNWSVTVERPAPVADAELTITVVATDPLGRRSTPVIVRVSQAP